ncbi:MAG: sugar phosphate isomerase/epimerase [Chloroflexi bacterium]|nr:sugar phosphate isomerase/epimerase [Chloroflexota bacterium]
MSRIRATLHGSQVREQKFALEEKIALAARHGYAGVDFSLGEVEQQFGSDTKAVRALLARYHVDAAAVGGVLGAHLFAAGDEWAVALRRLSQRAGAAASIGATRTGTVLWNRTFHPKVEAWSTVVTRIREVDQALAGTGVRLGVEFLGVRSLHPERPHVFVQSLVEMNHLLDEAGAANVGITLDSYHWYAAGDTLETIQQTPAQRIVLLHINDAKNVPKDELVDNDRLLPGEGVIPLAAWLDVIKSTGFDGFAGLEVLGPRLAGMDADACARIGIASLERL